MPGSAGGLVRMAVKRGAMAWNDDIRVALKNVALSPALSGPMGVTVIRGVGGTQDANGACLALDDVSVPCVTRGPVLHCR